MPRGNFAYTAPYEPTPEELKRERKGHKDFLTKHRKELAEVQLKIKNLNKDFKDKSKKLQDKIDKDVKIARDLEEQATRKEGLLKVLERRLKSGIKENESIKTDLLQEREDYKQTIRELEDKSEKDNSNTKSLKGRLIVKLGKVEAIRRESHLLKRDVIKLKERLSVSEQRLVIQINGNDNIKIELADELIKQRFLTRESYEKSTKLDTLIKIQNDINKKLQKKLKQRS